MKQETLEKIDALANEYLRYKKAQNKEKTESLKNKLCCEIFAIFLNEDNIDPLSSSFMSCITNWDGEGSFGKYFSFTLNKRKKDKFKKTKIEQITESNYYNREEKGLTVAYDHYEDEQCAYKEDYDNSVACYLEILIDGVAVTNNRHKSLKKINYTKLFFTETIATLPENQFTDYKEIRKLEKSIMINADPCFFNHFKIKNCPTLKDVYNTEFKLKCDFTHDAKDNCICLNPHSNELFSVVFISYILEKFSKNISDSSLSQQRSAYNNFRLEIKKTMLL